MCISHNKIFAFTIIRRLHVAMVIICSFQLIWITILVYYTDNVYYLQVFIATKSIYPLKIDTKYGKRPFSDIFEFIFSSPNV